MEKKPNFRKKGYDQYLSIFVLSFLFCYIVLNLHFFASGGAKSAVFSLFIATTNFQLIPASQLQPMRGVVWILVRVDKSMFAIYPTGSTMTFSKTTEPLQGGVIWYSTCQFFLEPIFEARMKQHGCLPNDSSLASAIYIPFYAGLDIGRHLWGYNVSVRDALSCELAQWVSARPERKRMWGRDHFVVGCRIS
ncbi:hypothetical protein CRG98_032633 [Punica granatum]|uniref:Exostosin GT47 domain-containing protein n=1 Tax=Punica granatum TaxID=22663 RepID=A0A2I0ISM4_PUNGR|nr:hypothetical protein CRG98_032633 [Punica granatum]